MKKINCIIVLVMLIGFVPGVCLAQTPVPGTPAYVTCFEPGSGGSVAYAVSGWELNDGFVVVFRPDEGYQPVPSSDFPIRINGVEVGFHAPTIPTEAYDEFVLSIYEIYNEDLLPDLDDAGLLLWGGSALTGGYLIPMPNPGHDLEWILFNFADLGTQDTFPVINGRPFAVKIEYSNYLGINNFLELEATTDYGGVCSFYNDTNIYCDASLSYCDFIENTVLDPANWIVHVKYDANVEYRLPSTTPLGLITLLILISSLIFMKKR